MNKRKKLFCIAISFILSVSWLHSEDKERIIIKTPFKPVKTVYPDYPEIFKQEGVAARMLFFISIDREGNVTDAKAWNSSYPDIEESLEQLFCQWKFEPYIHGGEPIRFSGFVMVIFFPGKLISLARQSEAAAAPQEMELRAPYNKELQMVLDKSAEYCMKLTESALYYICDEEIREKSNRLKAPNQEVGIIPPVALNNGLAKRGAYHNPLTLEDPERHVLVYDYQLIRKEGIIKENRILMEKDGKKAILENVPHAEKLSYNLKPILVPIQILGIEQRSKFSFRLADEEKINGKSAYVLKANLRPENQGNIKRGKIWVDKSDFRIVKIEVEAEFLPGYEHILTECYLYYLKPHFKSTHYYDIDKNGILFPSKSEIRVKYSGFLRNERKLKSEAKISYRDYKFFTVETNHEIIKKKLEALLSNWSNQPIKRLIWLSPGNIKHF